ncbi:MAG: hypothetical protein QXD48_00840 [Candidatus Aenigmatarchaeota archaeon]
MIQINDIDATTKLIEELDNYGFYNAVILIRSREGTKFVAFKDLAK